MENLLVHFIHVNYAASVSIHSSFLQFPTLTPWTDPLTLPGEWWQVQQAPREGVLLTS